MFAHVMRQRWMKGLVVTALAALVLSGCGGGAGSTEQQQSPSEPTQQRSGGERGRWSSRRKTEVVLRVLRGEDRDALSRELGVTAGAIAQ